MKRCIKSSLTEKTAALSASWGLRTSRPRAGIASLLIYDWKLSLREKMKTVIIVVLNMSDRNRGIREKGEPILLVRNPRVDNNGH